VCQQSAATERHRVHDVWIGEVADSRRRRCAFNDHNDPGGFLRLAQHGFHQSSDSGGFCFGNHDEIGIEDIGAAENKLLQERTKADHHNPGSPDAA
jgi:hypothetical protein